MAGIMTRTFPYMPSPTDLIMTLEYDRSQLRRFSGIPKSSYFRALW